MSRISRQHKAGRRTREAERRDPPWLRAERCDRTADWVNEYAGTYRWIGWYEAELLAQEAGSHG